MGLALTSPVTGGAQTGTTSPTFTLTADRAPSPNGIQDAVTALGGTQVGVTVHSASSPFTTSRFRPSQLKMLPAANPITGIVKSVPNNVYKDIVRKGVTPYSGAPAHVMTIIRTISVPAGAETYDSANVRAALSLSVGVSNQLSAAWGDACVSGII